MKNKLIVGVFVVAIMTGIIASSAFAASCSGWEDVEVVSRYCDINSGWCYLWDDHRYSHYQSIKQKRYCDGIGWQYQTITVKDGCCSQ